MKVELFIWTGGKELDPVHITLAPGETIDQLQIRIDDVPVIAADDYTIDVSRKWGNGHAQD